jgi:hypothetical protein
MDRAAGLLHELHNGRHMRGGRNRPHGDMEWFGVDV